MWQRNSIGQRKSFICDAIATEVPADQLSCFEAFRIGRG